MKKVTSGYQVSSEPSAAVSNQHLAEVKEDLHAVRNSCDTKAKQSWQDESGGSLRRKKFAKGRNLQRKKFAKEEVCKGRISRRKKFAKGRNLPRRKTDIESSLCYVGF